MSFYLAAVDDPLRQAADGPTIGVILCRNQEHIVVGYALREQRRPIGVSEYCVTRELPAPLRNALPSPQDLVDFASGFVSKRGREVSEQIRSSGGGAAS